MTEAGGGWQLYLYQTDGGAGDGQSCIAPHDQRAGHSLLNIKTLPRLHHGTSPTSHHSYAARLKISLFWWDWVHNILEPEDQQDLCRPVVVEGAPGPELSPPEHVSVFLCGIMSGAASLSTPLFYPLSVVRQDVNHLSVQTLQWPQQPDGAERGRDQVWAVVVRHTKGHYWSRARISIRNVLSYDWIIKLMRYTGDGLRFAKSRQSRVGVKIIIE